MMGARTIALGRAFTGTTGYLWSMSYNPSGIVGLQGIEAGMYAERRFSMKELTYGGICVALPYKDNHYLGAEVGSFGFSNYRENKIGLNYATTIAKVLNIGTKVNFAQTSITDIGNALSIYADVGLNVAVTKNLRFGVTASNVNQAKVRTQNAKQPLPTVLTAGIAYQVTDKVLIVADANKDFAQPISFRGGVEYQFGKGLAARIGASHYPLSVNFGVGWQYKNFTVDFASSIHERLGYTPALSAAYRFNKKAK